MAKESMKAREAKRTKLVAKYAEKFVSRLLVCGTDSIYSEYQEPSSN